ncbi:MAG: phosphomannose isomerase type II C-terminal cupin domain [Candidatus Omnitrophica bacterium]|nr:phosphomannose isomerase type II C-terminal cupin domain [Candidatus Omnitrophota bacterium]
MSTVKLNFYERPWGHYIKIFEDNGVWVKRVEVKPGSRLSLQKHEHRSEKWNIISGKALITINSEDFEAVSGSVIDVPVGAIHRITNIGNKQLIFIEVACGENLSEEDIIRLEDDYQRG